MYKERVKTEAMLKKIGKASFCTYQQSTVIVPRIKVFSFMAYQKQSGDINKICKHFLLKAFIIFVPKVSDGKICFLLKRFYFRLHS